MAKNWKDFIEDDPIKNNEVSLEFITTTTLKNSSKDKNLNKLLQEQKELEKFLKKLTKKENVSEKFSSPIPTTAQRKIKEQKWLQNREKILKNSFIKKLELKSWEKKREEFKRKSIKKNIDSSKKEMNIMEQLDKRNSNAKNKIAKKTELKNWENKRNTLKTSTPKQKEDHNVIKYAKKTISIMDKLDKRNINAKKKRPKKLELKNWENKRNTLKSNSSKSTKEVFIKKHTKKGVSVMEELEKRREKAIKKITVSEKIGFEKVTSKPIKKRNEKMDYFENKREILKRNRLKILSQKKKFEKLIDTKINDTKLFEKREINLKQKIKVAREETRALQRKQERKEEQKREEKKQKRLNKFY